MSFYPAERYQHDLELMLDPSKWWCHGVFYVKRWTDNRMETGQLIYRDNLYHFMPDSGGPSLKGGFEVPETIVKNGWVAD